MRTSLRFGSALSAVALASMIGGCAAQSGPRGASIFGEEVDTSNIALATRASLALAAKDFNQAISLAERAVGNTPRDAGFRSLLGNAYFGAGRFASAEAAYKDSLALLANQPQVVTKLALVLIAQGKGNEAIAFLDAAQQILDPSDHGLALALAGQPQRAVAVLDPAARQMGADSRLRQNLALAHALSGDWESARIVAAQDLSPAYVDARVAEWMQFAKADRASDQIAALTGVSPAAVDPGQPTRLALAETDTLMAAIEPTIQDSVAAPTAPAPEVQMAEASVVPAEPQFAALAPIPDVPAPTPTLAPAPAPAPSAELPVKRAAAYVPATAVATRAAPLRKTGKSGAVVQLGAYSSHKNVASAWDQFARKYAVLQGYTPMSAEFDTGKGTVYRLSVRGFEGVSDAKALCSSLRRKGKNCFVRNVAGDSPVNFAAR